MSKPVTILGIHKDPWHNTGACIIKDDGKSKNIAFLSEERLDRKKDSRNFPDLSIQACMKQLNINSFDDFDMINDDSTNIIDQIEQIESCILELGDVEDDDPCFDNSVQSYKNIPLSIHYLP